MVEHRLAKARAAGSNPVSCFLFLPGNVEKAMVSGLLCVWKVVDNCRQLIYREFKKIILPAERENHLGNLIIRKAKNTDAND